MSTRKKIIDEALLLFIEKGYENVTVDEICGKCNITKPTFYYHLSSKDEIILEYYDIMMDDLSPMLTKMITTQDPHDQIIILFNFLIKGIKALSPYTNNQLFISNLKENKGTFDLRDNFKKIGIEIIKKGQKNLIFNNKSNPEKILSIASHLFMGYEIMWCIEQKDDNWESDFFEGLDHLLGYEKS